MIRIDCGHAADPWYGNRPVSETPEIDPSALVRGSDFGAYTFIGARSIVTGSEIHDYAYAMGDNQIAHATVGKFCNIATAVRINPSNHPWWRATLHHFTYRSRSHGFELEDDESFFRWRAEDRVVIEPDVWIGHGAIIMPGVRIGCGAVVGSGAVVTRDVSPYSIVVGVPATVLRPRVDAATAEKLQRIAWWDWSRERLEAALPDFRHLDATAFAEKYDR
jgi:phosphonate metabolism protein (transferase hexapeptide repeat family)